MEVKSKYSINEEVWTVVNGEIYTDRINHITCESGLVKEADRGEIIKDRIVYTIGKKNPPVNREEHYVWKTEEELIEATEEKTIRLPRPVEEKKETTLKLSKCCESDCDCKE